MEKELRLLLDRYLDGLTTLEEEAWLAEYFRTNEVGKELMPFKEMFGVIEEDVKKISGPTPVLPGWGGRMVTPVVPRRARIVLRVVSWGAAVAAIVLLGFVLRLGNVRGKRNLRKWWSLWWLRILRQIKMRRVWAICKICRTLKRIIAMFIK